MTKPKDRTISRESQLLAMIDHLESKVGEIMAERDEALENVHSLRQACASARAAMMRYRAASLLQSEALLKFGDAQDEWDEFDVYFRSVPAPGELPF